MDGIVQLRKDLHRIAELSGRETRTAERIHQELKAAGADSIVDGLGGCGIAAVFHPGGSPSGHSLMFRAELDALPIPEETNISHASVQPGVSHKCGHDGHMAALVGLAQRISARRNELRSRVALLFQPSEENGAGARAVCADPRFKDLVTDRIIGWHNLPGYAARTVVLREGIFTSASRGITVRLHGTTSHAAHPEDGNSPLSVLAHLLQALPLLPRECVPFHRAALVTIVGARLGKGAFGTLPGTGTIQATFRAHRAADMEAMVRKGEHLIRAVCEAHGIRCDISWEDLFEPAVNDAGCVADVAAAAVSLKLPVEYLEQPFAWSEDFGVFTTVMPGVLVGIGAGVSCPQLHHPDYDFPDEILPDVVDLMEHLAFDTGSVGRMTP